MLRLISHELRTPLNAIIGFSEIIATELYGPIDEPRYREHAALVHDAGTRMAKLVNDVIELARLETGVADVDLQAEDISPLLQEVADAVSAELETRGVALSVAGSDLPSVRIDRRLMKAALADLTRHAAATAPTGGTLALCAHRRGVEVILSITHGPTVPHRDTTAVARPLDILAATLTRENDGLGLPIAQLAIRAMGGRLRLTVDDDGRVSMAAYLKSAV